MSPSIHPHDWSEFFAECLFYFVPFSVVHGIAFVVGSFVIATFSSRQPGIIIERIRRFGLFLILLLVVSSIFNGVWSCTIWGRLYYSTDYVFDFTPFWPITRSVINMPFGDQRGQLFGVSLTQLNMVWLLFVIGTYGVTVLLYRAVQQRLDFKHAPNAS
jgi:hypothetical protein